MRDVILPVFFAFVASGAFSVIYNIRGLGVLICAFGGGLAWFSYLLFAPLLQNEIIQTFVAALVISVYAEVMARVRKCPVTGYLLVAIFPLVPGGGIYYTMEYAMRGEVDQFLLSFLHTLGLAGAIAVGVLLVSSAVRMWTAFRRQTPLPRKEDRP